MPFPPEFGFAVAFSDVAEVRRLFQADWDLDTWTAKGETLLLSAIRDSAPAALIGKRGTPATLVEALIELGANPNKPDRNGWTPWMVCVDRLHDPVVAEEQAAIRAILERCGVDRRGEEAVLLCQRVAAGDFAALKAAVAAGIDPNAPPLPCLPAAVGAGHTEMVSYLLQHGAVAEPPRPAGDELSLLIHAAMSGRLEIVQLLVAHGADIGHAVGGSDEGTAEAYARREGHRAVADWLEAHTPAEVLAARARRVALRKPKYKKLFTCGTNGVNHDLTTDAIALRLDEWDQRYGLTLAKVDASGLTVKFKRLPQDVPEFAREVYEFCPDTVEQGFETVEALAASIKATKEVALWWD